MKTITLLIFGVVILVLGLVYISTPDINVPKANIVTYVYEIRTDTDRYTDSFSIIVDKKFSDNRIDIGYTVFSGTDIALYMKNKYKITDVDILEKYAHFTENQFEGLSADGKFVSGKLIDPTTKKQIGHWTYDLDKKDFSEFTLELPR